MMSGFPNPLQKAEEVLRVSQGEDSSFGIHPAQILFREFQQIAILIDKNAQNEYRSLFYQFSDELMKKPSTAIHYRNLIMSQLEKRGYQVIFNKDAEHKLTIKW